MALHLAERGVDVIITYRGAADEAQARSPKEIRGQGRKAVALPLDVGDSRDLRRLRGTVQRHATSAPGARPHRLPRQQRRHRRCTRRSPRPPRRSSTSSWPSTSRAPFFLTQKLLPLLADGGRILNVSSGLARFALPGYAAYAAMKGGVEVLTRYMAKELGARRISVNTIAPGAIETDFGGGAVRDNAGSTSSIASQTALGRVGLPDDIGAAVALLLSPEARWITGQRIEVSGGQML